MRFVLAITLPWGRPLNTPERAVLLCLLLYLREWQPQRRHFIKTVSWIERDQVFEELFTVLRD